MALRTEGHPDTDLPRATADQIGQHAEQPHRRQGQPHRSEQAEQRHREPRLRGLFLHRFLDGPRVAQRQLGIQGGHLAAHRVENRGRLALGADGQGAPRRGHEGVRDERGRLGFLGEAVVARVRADADDREFRGKVGGQQHGTGQLFKQVRRDLLAQRIHSGRPEFRGRLIDDGEAFAAPHVLRTQHTPPTQGDPERLEIVGADEIEGERPGIGAGLPIDGVAGGRAAKGRSAIADLHRLHARKAADPFEQLFGELVPLLQRGVAGPGQHHIRRDDILGAKAQLHLLERQETPNREARADQQHDGQRHLDHHQGRTKGAALGHSPGRAFVFERAGQVGPGGLQGRHQSEHDAGDQRHHDAEEQHVAIHLDTRLVGHVEGGHQHHHQSRDRHPEREAEKSAQAGQQHALGQQLADQPPPPCPDGQADGHLLRPATGSGELEVRHVRTGDQQQEGDRAEQELQGVLHLAARRSEVQIIRQGGFKLLLGKSVRIGLGQLRIE